MKTAGGARASADSLAHGNGRANGHKAEGGGLAELARRTDAPEQGLPRSLLGSVSHEIRSPLGLITGALDELEHELSGQPDGRHERLFELARRGAERLGRLAQLLSVAARIDTDELKIEPVPTDLASLLTQTVQTLDAIEPRRGVTVDIRVSEGTRPPLDELHAPLVFLEVLSVARRRARSVVVVSSETVPGGHEIRVEDDGRVWDTAERNRAFELTGRATGGRETGLALAVARDVIAAHGGDLRLEPSGRGGCFVFFLKR